LELPLAGDLELFALRRMLFFRGHLLFSGFAFALFKSSFGSQGIDFSLTVSSFFLHGSKTGYFHLLFLFDALLFCGFSTFASGFALVVLNDFLFLIDFLLAGLLFLRQCNFISSLNLSNHFQIADPLFLGNLNLS